MPHAHPHAFGFLNAGRRDGVLLSRRNLLKAGAAGFGALTLPNLLRARESARAAPKSVILLWMAGGPSQIDTLDPKPDRPAENRGPFGVIRTRLPGVQVCEHLPKLAGALDRFTVIRSVDPRGSNHEPNTVMQTANLLAEPRTNPEARTYPAVASLVAKLRGANHPLVPAYVAFMKSRSHVAFGGLVGKQYDPFLANEAARLPVYDLVGTDTGQLSGGKMFELPADVSAERMSDRQRLLKNFDRLRSEIDKSGAMAGLEKYFGAWKPGQVPAMNVTEPPDATRRVIVVDKKDTVQTEIRVGQIAIPRKHNDYEAVDQAVKILGGEGANRLQQVLLVEHAATRDVHHEGAGLHGRENPGVDDLVGFLLVGHHDHEKIGLAGRAFELSAAHHRVEIRRGTRRPRDADHAHHDAGHRDRGRRAGFRCGQSGMEIGSDFAWTGRFGFA